MSPSPPPAWIFFDVGWTLVDESVATTAYYEAALAAAPSPGDATPKSLFARHAAAMAGGNWNPFTQVLESIGLTADDRRRFGSYQELERVYRDTEPALRALSSVVKMGVLANQPSGLVERLTRFGLTKYFEVILGSSDVGCKKPDSAFFRMAAARAGQPPENLMMAGDRLDNDIAPAKALGWQTAWIRRIPLPDPHHEHETPDHEFTNLRKLAATLVPPEHLRLIDLVDADGMISAWPASPADKGLVLGYLADQFTPGREYTEAEVNAIIERHHRFGDYALLRREMIVRGLLDRDAYGRSYRRATA